MEDTVRVDVWSDIACPWCWVGKRRLESAIERFAGNVEVRWHAFELDPGASRAPDSADKIDYVERLARKYGVDREQAQGFIDRMVSCGRDEGIEFRFDRIRPGNTFDAHRLLALAAAGGKQNAVKERLFEAYMTEGKSVADKSVLADIAIDLGLDADEVAAVLDTDEGAEHVRGDERAAAQMGVTGVPFFVIDGRYGVAGAQPAEVLLEILDKSAAENTTAAAPDGPACGPDGCD